MLHAKISPLSDEKQKTRNGGDDQLGILPKLNTDLIVVHDDPSLLLSSSQRLMKDA